MPGACILTDNTVQYPLPVFPGRKYIQTIYMHIEMHGQRYQQCEGLKAQDFPKSYQAASGLKALAPSVEEFIESYERLAQHYTDIIVILHSSQFSQTFINAAAASKIYQGASKIHLIDSQSIGTGLGLLVQAAAAMLENNLSPQQIEDEIRNFLPRLYSLFFIEGLTYLSNSGYLGKSQAVIAEHLKFLPMYVLDDNEFTPTQKARNYRHLVDLLHEFLYEFIEIEHVAILQAVPAFENETRALRERMLLDFGETPISEHTINTPIAAILGPRSLGMFVLQGEAE